MTDCIFLGAGEKSALLNTYVLYGKHVLKSPGSVKEKVSSFGSHSEGVC